jgi:hypothetical protein
MRRLRFAPLGTRAARLLSASALFLAAACSDTAPTAVPLTNRFYYPTGLAVRHVDDGGAPRDDCRGGDANCHTQLFVASSNFDLRFDAATGGTVIAVDVDKALATGMAPLQAPALLGVARIGSFAGEVTLLDGKTCGGYAGGDQVLVASRSQNTLYRVSIGAQGQLSCGDGCAVPLESTFGDPYGVTVACGDFGQFAFVTYLRTPNAEGQLSKIDLTTGARTQIDLGAGTPTGTSIAPAHSTVFDPVSTRLYVTEEFGENSFSPFRWFSVAAPETPANSVDLFSFIRGAEIRGMALSSDGAAGQTPSRGYLALRIYDADTAATTGVRPLGDVAGALAIMDLTQGPNGQPAASLVNLVPIDRGASQIRIVPRIDPQTGKQRIDPSSGNPLRDLVAISCTDDNTVVLYDDDTGSVAQVFDVCGAGPGPTAPPPCDPGNPLTGKQPFGLATETLSSGHVRLYVGSFDRSWVNVIEIDPLNPAAAPVSWTRIGPERQ